MIWCPPHCVTLHKIWVSSSTAPTQGRHFTPCSSSTLLPAKQTQEGILGQGTGGHCTAAERVSLQHVTVLASSIPFFPLHKRTLQLSGLPTCLDTVDTSAAGGLRRAGLSNHCYCGYLWDKCVIYCVASLLADVDVGCGSWVPVAASMSERVRGVQQVAGWKS